MYLGIIPFVLGLAGLVGFWFVREREEQRGTRLAESHRATLDRVVAEAYHTLVAGDALHTHRLRFFALVHNVSHRVVIALVAALRAVERPLARVSHRMRMEPPKSPREPSEFLKTITPDKKTTDTL